MVKKRETSGQKFIEILSNLHVRRVHPRTFANPTARVDRASGDK